MSKCVKCGQRKGKRECPALGGLICSQCCGEFRLVEIECPRDCRYLGGAEAYQEERRFERARREGQDYLRERVHAFSDTDEALFETCLHLDEIIFESAPPEGWTNAEVLEALRQVRGETGGIVVAGEQLTPLAEKILARLKMFEEHRAPWFSRAGLKTALERLHEFIARRERAAPGNPRAYFEWIRPYFSALHDPRPRTHVHEHEAKEEKGRLWVPGM